MWIIPCWPLFFFQDFGSQTEYGFCIENSPPPPLENLLALGLHTRAADKEVLVVCAGAVLRVLRISPKTIVVLAWTPVVTVEEWMNLQEAGSWWEDARPVLKGEIVPLKGLLGYWAPPFPLYLTAAVG